MNEKPIKSVEELLSDWRQGDETAKNELIDEIYPQLKEIAIRLFRREVQGHTLQATAVANEACIKLLSKEPDWTSKTHFLAFSARLMRHILVDYARTKKAEKRGGGAFNVTLHEEIIHNDTNEENNVDILALDSALEELSQIDDIATQAIEQRFFAGLTNQDIAELLSTSLATVERKIKFAKAFLYKKLS